MKNKHVVIALIVVCMVIAFVLRQNLDDLQQTNQPDQDYYQGNVFQKMGW